MVLEQSKHCAPHRIVTYINERKVKTLREAAILTDENILTHKSSFDMLQDDGDSSDCSGL